MEKSGRGRVAHGDAGQAQSPPADMDRLEAQIFQPELFRLGDEDNFR